MKYLETLLQENSEWFDIWAQSEQKKTQKGVENITFRQNNSNIIGMNGKLELFQIHWNFLLSTVFAFTLNC